METFKLPANLRNAFKLKLKTRPGAVKVKQEPLIQNIKQEINNHEQTNIFANKVCKKEPNTEPFIPMGWSNASSFGPEPKHEIDFSELKFNDTTSSNSTKNNNKSIKSNSKPNSHKKRTVPNRIRRPKIVDASRIYRNLSARDPESLTQKQLDSLGWAESVLFNRTTRRYAAASPAIEEIPDEDSNDQLNEAFITEPTVHEIPDTLQLAVIDSTATGGRYNLLQARLIEQSLSKAVINYILANPNAKQPIFGKSVYFDGVLVLDCKDNTTYEFAKLVLSDMKLWPGSRLKLKEPERTPFASIGSLHIQNMGIEKNLVLKILRIQNPTVNMSNWKVLGETTYNKEGYKEYSILMSNPPVYFQRHKQLRLYFGGSEVILKRFGCQWLWHCKV